MLEAYRRNGIDLDVIWMDAGWYTGANGETVGWGSTGTLDIDYSRFPDGMSSIGEYAKEIDAMYLLWFEPEVMRLDTEAFLAGQPDFEREWLMGNAGGFMGGQIIDRFGVLTLTTAVGFISLGFTVLFGLTCALGRFVLKIPYVSERQSV